MQRLLAAVLLPVWSVAHCRLFCQRLHSHLLQLVDAVSTQAPAGCVAAAVSGEVSQAKRLKTLTGGPAQRQVGMVGPMHNGGMHGVQHSSEVVSCRASVAGNIAYNSICAAFDCFQRQQRHGS